MSHHESSREAERLLLAFDLFETGLAMMIQTLRRRHGELPDTELEKLLGAWLRLRPGAEHGDAVGRKISWPGGRGKR